MPDAAHSSEREAPGTRPKETPRDRSIPPAVVLLVTALAFLPSLQNGFVNWDDPYNITENWAYRGLGWAQLRWMFTTYHMGHYQPLAWVTLGADFLIWGMNPLGYHLTSLLFHLANTVLFYAVALRLLACAAAPQVKGSAAAGTPAPCDAIVFDPSLRIAAAFAAGVFALHPLRVESVAWATERRDVVSGLFFLISVLLYVDGTLSRSAAGRAARRWTSILAFGLALLGKSITVTLPAILVVLDIYPLRRLARGRDDAARGRATFAALVIEKIPYFVLAALAIVNGFIALRSSEEVAGLTQFGILNRLSVAAYGLVFYLWETILPAGLSAAHVLPADFHPASAPFMASAVGVILLTAALVATRQRYPALLAAWLAYAISLLPVLGVVQVWRQFVAERYSYLSCLGAALLLGGGLLILLRRHRTVARVATTLPCVVLAVLALLTTRQVGAWHDTETLWKQALAADPGNYLADMNLGAHYGNGGRIEQARAKYLEALRVYPGLGDAWAGLGALALKEGKTSEAADYLNRALASGTSTADVYLNLGVIHFNRGDTERAIAAFRRALSFKPAAFKAWRGLGAAYGRAGNLDQAVMAWREAARLNPEDTSVRRRLANALFHAGEQREALAVAIENVKHDPTDLESANLVAWIRATSQDATLRDGKEAERLARQAVEAAGDSVPPHLLDTYGAALAELGRFEQAAAAAQSALERAIKLGDTAQARESSEHLRLYKRREPYRAR